MTEAERIAEALDRRAPHLDGVPTIMQAAALIRSQAAEIERLREALENVSNMSEEASISRYARSALEVGK